LGCGAPHPPSPRGVVVHTPRPPSPATSHAWTCLLVACIQHPTVSLSYLARRPRPRPAGGDRRHLPRAGHPAHPAVQHRWVGARWQANGRRRGGLSRWQGQPHHSREVGQSISSASSLQQLGCMPAGSFRAGGEEGNCCSGAWLQGASAAARALAPQMTRAPRRRGSGSASRSSRKTSCTCAIDWGTVDTN